MKKEGYEKDPLDGMPIDLVMLLEVRCEALSKYRDLGVDAKRRVDEAALRAHGRREKNELIDRVEEGFFG